MADDVVEGDDAHHQKMSVKVMMFIGSLVVVLQATVDCIDKHDTVCSGKRLWGIAGGGVSAAITLILIVSRHWQLCDVSDPTKLACAMFLATWWMVGVGTLTFFTDSPYRTLSNGYIGAWFAMIFAWCLCISKIPALHESLKQLGDMALAVLMLASMVLTFQAGIDCTETECSGKRLWGVICGAASMAMCFLLIVFTYRPSLSSPHAGDVTRHPSSLARDTSSASPVVLLFFLGILTWWWIAGVAMLTFGDAPYFETGNGYFAAWAALFACAFMSHHIAVQGRGTLHQDSAAAERDKEMHNTRHLAIIFGASLVLLFVTTATCKNGTCDLRDNWAVLCCSISFVVCSTVLVVENCSQVRLSRPPLAIFFFLWWACGTGTMTFEGEFSEAGNGYFAAWAALVASWSLLCRCTRLRNLFERTCLPPGPELSIALFSSLVLTVKSSVDCDKQDWCTEYYGWAVACGAVSFVAYSLMLLLADYMGFGMMKLVLLGLTIWWCAGVGVLTFGHPYKLEVGNAYFAIWSACIATVMLFYKLGTYGDEDEGRSQPLDEEEGYGDEGFDQSASGQTTAGPPAAHAASDFSEMSRVGRMEQSQSVSQIHGLGTMMGSTYSATSQSVTMDGTEMSASQSGHTQRQHTERMEEAPQDGAGGHDDANITIPALGGRVPHARPHSHTGE